MFPRYFSMLSILALSLLLALATAKVRHTALPDPPWKHDRKHESWDLKKGVKAIPFPIAKSGCMYDKRPLDPSHKRAAKGLMFTWCKEGVLEAGETVVVFGKERGEVDYWICYQTARRTLTGCSVTEWQYAETAINQRCGRHKGGWVTSKKRGLTWGRSFRHEDILCPDYKWRD